MSKKIHNQFLDISGSLSDRLQAAIHLVGPVKLQPQLEQPLAERLFGTVAGQQLSTTAAGTIWGRVVDSTNGRPLVEHMAATKPDVLRKCGLSGAKIKAMKAIAEAHEKGLLNVDELSRMNHEERSRRLIDIRGVGPWTADMIGIFYFGDQDIWPDSDLTASKTLERLTSKRRKTSRTADLFAPHRSYLAMYMYRFADLE